MALREIQGKPSGPTRPERADSGDAELYRAPKMDETCTGDQTAASVTGARCGGVGIWHALSAESLAAIA
jgi:hypothetical protein